MYSQLKIVLGVSLLLIFSCEETPPKAGYSFQIEATSLTIEPILSQKITQSNTSFDWSNVVYENGDGYEDNCVHKYTNYFGTLSNYVTIDELKKVITERGTHIYLGATKRIKKEKWDLLPSPKNQIEMELKEVA